MTKIYPKTKWVRARPRRYNQSEVVCPVCKHRDWCLVAADGSAAICPRTPSNKWVGTNGGGYLHVFKEKVEVEAEKVGEADSEPRAKPRSSAEIINLMKQYRTAINSERLDKLAAGLGLTVASLNRLGIGWAYDKSAWALPMRNAAGDLMGIRLRSAEGRKFSVAGGHEGLFVPTGISNTNTLLFCEGPTTCAALLDLGFDVVGRPSCMGGVDQVRDLLTQNARREVVVVGDRDEAKPRPDGSTFRPGQDGATRLAQAIGPLCRSLKIILPPFVKDARDWKAAGATHAVVQAVINSANYVRKE